MALKRVFNDTSVMPVERLFLAKRQLNIDEDLLWEEYVKGKQTYAQLAEKI